MDDNMYNEVIQANIELFSKSSFEYELTEPQYRPENLKRVQDLLKKEIDQLSVKRVLDLGCGTGFIINLIKEHVEEIVGVDVTQVMLDRVDKTGRAKIELVCSDTGTYPVAEETFDMVTAHSFLHHLYDIKSTVNTAAKALKTGGVFVNELDPNYYFWESVSKLDQTKSYSPLLNREILAVHHVDDNLDHTYGVDINVFNKAEYGKNIKGGFKEEELIAILLEAGFSNVDIKYHWFLGESMIVNNSGFDKEINLLNAKQFDEVLKNTLPLSRHLYKYIGFVATK
jgi:ubiquinone/menaquinone biosynthesis C-methylase UbiE